MASASSESNVLRRVVVFSWSIVSSSVLALLFVVFAVLQSQNHPPQKHPLPPGRPGRLGFADGQSALPPNDDGSSRIDAATGITGAWTVRQSRCPTCQFPIHSWDTVPVSFHCARSNTKGPTGTEFTGKDLESLRRYPLITLEKWQGVDAYSTTSNSSVFVWLQDAWESAARQIKAVHPTAAVIVWMDTELVYTGWTWPPPRDRRRGEPPPLNTTFNPDIKAPCTTGYFRPAEFLEAHREEYLLHNTSELPALEPWSGCHVYDHTKETVRRYWMELCLNMTSTGVIDGCGADFSSLEKNNWYYHTAKYVKRTLKVSQSVAEAWNAGHRQMMVETTAALAPNGLLIGKDARELGDHVSGVLQESCPARNTTITRLRNLTATAKRLGRRLVYQCHSQGINDNGLAAFLIGAGPDHYLTVGSWKPDKSGFPSHWHPNFEKPLGEPVSDGKYNAKTHQWTRVFGKHGTTVLFNASNNQGSILWAELDPISDASTSSSKAGGNQGSGYNG